MNTNWISLYIFKKDPFDPFLKNALAPVIKQLRGQKLIKAFFFIRYNENGPHIRVRVLTISGADEKKVKDFLIGQFNNYFTSLNKIQVTEPTDYRMELHEYVPEIDRYGGKEGIKVAESLFEASSNAILKFYDYHDILDYNSALGVAVQMHFILIKMLLDMKENEITTLLNFMADGWISRAANYNSDMDKQVFQKRKEELSTAFEKSYQLQKHLINHLLRNAQKAIKAERMHKAAYLSKWAQDLKLIKPFYKEFDLRSHREIDNVKLSIIASYLHMTNNRLGIRNSDESFINYLLLKGLSDLDSQER